MPSLLLVSSLLSGSAIVQCSIKLTLLDCGNTFYHVGCILLLRSGYLGSVPDAIGEGNEEVSGLFTIDLVMNMTVMYIYGHEIDKTITVRSSETRESFIGDCCL